MMFVISIYQSIFAIKWIPVDRRKCDKQSKYRAIDLIHSDRMTRWASTCWPDSRRRALFVEPGIGLPCMIGEPDAAWNGGGEAASRRRSQSPSVG